MMRLNILSIGIGFIIIGFIIVFIGAALGALKHDSNVKFSFFGLIGPIPIGFSNDKRLFIFTIIMAMVMLFLLLFFYFRGLK